MNETNETKTQIKHLDTSANSFEANGNKYLILGSITTARYQKFEALQAQLAWGIEFESMYANVRKLYDLLNKVKFAEAAVLANNILEAVIRPLEGREHPMLMLCTIFCVRENEDLSKWDETNALEKIADWKAECIAIEDFFALAFNSVRGLSAVYLESLAGTSDNNPDETQNENDPTN